MRDRYSAVLGFNSKQWWAYDEKTNEYIDPPIDVLDEINQNGGCWQTNPDKAEEYFNMLLSKEPNWLNDAEHRYPGDTTDI